jgi:hypothetical protein
MPILVHHRHQHKVHTLYVRPDVAAEDFGQVIGGVAGNSPVMIAILNEVIRQQGYDDGIDQQEGEKNPF